MTKQIVFNVTDEVAEQMTHQSVYLDVFGHVRWFSDLTAVAGATQWGMREV